VINEQKETSSVDIEDVLLTSDAEYLALTFSVKVVTVSGPVLRRAANWAVA